MGCRQKTEGLDTIISLPPIMVCRKLLFMNQAAKMALGTRLPLEFPGRHVLKRPLELGNGACVFTQGFVTSRRDKPGRG